VRAATVVYRDPTLKHQIIIGTVFSLKPWGLSVSCNCRVRAGLPPLAVKPHWRARGKYSGPDDEVQLVYQAHLKEVAA
jgi:hypothetical protein